VKNPREETTQEPGSWKFGRTGVQVMKPQVERCLPAYLWLFLLNDKTGQTRTCTTPLLSQSASALYRGIAQAAERKKYLSKNLTMLEAELFARAELALATSHLLLRTYKSARRPPQYRWSLYGNPSKALHKRSIKGSRIAPTRCEPIPCCRSSGGRELYGS
jgi:hypothetical protein